VAAKVTFDFCSAKLFLKVGEFIDVV